MMNGNDIEDDEKVEDKKSYYKMYFSVKWLFIHLLFVELFCLYSFFCMLEKLN